METIERIWKRKVIPSTETGESRVEAGSGPCLMRRTWSVAVPHRDKARSTPLVENCADKFLRSNEE